MDDLVHATPPADTLWKDDHLIDDDAANEKERRLSDGQCRNSTEGQEKD